ncbi:BQ2448_5391 [Microbotryum intermedium]|uniref:BQ2448_5391 protein n=1 Tax=Microbotryum intermedium TaxID=269621 RepID=A0A238F0V3_9BASI|nr:BQ2448_5391 [Microbotryum intermedium]
MLKPPGQPHSESRLAAGIPLRVLLDRREHFLPRMMYRFFEVAARQPEIRFYKEAEAMRHYCLQKVIQLENQSSWNIFSPEVRAVWQESWQFYHGDRGVWTDYWRIIKYSGYLQREDPELDPPLRRSNNLAHRLGVLPSFQKDRVICFCGLEPTPGSSGFLEGELDHFKSKSVDGHPMPLEYPTCPFVLPSTSCGLAGRGGIRFDGFDTPGFDVVVDARSNFLPKDDEIMGLPALLPTGRLPQQTDSGSQEDDSN